MTISEAVQRRPKRIARSLVSRERDDAEQILYLAQNLTLQERQLLLSYVKEVRIMLFNLRGYEA